MKSNIEMNADLLWFVKQFRSTVSKKIKSKHMVNYYESNVRKFTKDLQEQGLKDYKDLNVKNLLDLFEKDVEYDPKPIRSFLRFLFDNGICNTDFGFLVPKKKARKRLPSFFTQEEINKVLNSIDRSSNTGKRNYLVMLLAARLCLNSRQICNLKYSDVKNGRIHTVSSSGKALQFPLTEEIERALIEHHEVNKQNNSPYIVFAQEEENNDICNGVTRIIKTEFKRAGIDDERIIGIKSLKNSLVRDLRERGIEYSTITQGYDSSIRSIKRYQKIEYEKLRECILEIDVNRNDEFNNLLRGENGI